MIDTSRVDALLEELNKIATDVHQGRWGLPMMVGAKLRAAVQRWAQGEMQPTATPVTTPVCDADLRLIFEHGEPSGIRDRTGFLCHFRRVPKFSGQEERYRTELAQRARLADFLLESLKRACPTKQRRVRDFL
jgi:hypothetical protein